MLLQTIEEKSIYLDVLLANFLYDWGVKPNASKAWEKHRSDAFRISGSSGMGDLAWYHTCVVEKEECFWNVICNVSWENEKQLLVF